MNCNERRAHKSEEYICIVNPPRRKTLLQRLSNSMDTQWIKLSPEMVAVATANSAWLYKPNAQINLDRYGQSMKNLDGSIESTQNLLDAAIAAAYYQYSEAVLPDLTLADWIWQLAGHYHLTCLTPKLMKEASQGFAIANYPTLAKWARRKANREQDYNRNTLQDIRYLGYNAEAVVAEFHPTQARSLIDYLEREKSLEPMDCVGYSYTIERIATRIEQEYIQLVCGLLPPSLTCITAPTSRPWLYGSVGVDIGDVQETVEAIAELKAEDRIRVARACYETALLCFAPSEQGFVPDSEIEPVLESMKL